MSVFTFSEGMKNGISLTKSSEFNKIKKQTDSLFFKGGELLETRNEIKKK